MSKFFSSEQSLEFQETNSQYREFDHIFESLHNPIRDFEFLSTRKNKILSFVEPNKQREMELIKLNPFPSKTLTRNQNWSV
ncbi:hypothetical protein OIU77_029558 [Salix suchowensis]|uniref:Uncharacterized protein n=1 Tax=Salix suchowensis TaxID=1278906 RepID=A0ABQ9BC44_9ROSI|nr:hypothetical protein OIU77_029558 [Salix suchowensis]